jgi:exopolyphosphatase/guanosine-5'-triphosphate,3'-diphosphate pyrophosphatase
VLTGDEEARYSAQGVLAGAPDSQGVVADLGGASLELVRLSREGAGPGVSLPVGPFSLGNATDLSPERLRKKVRALIEPVAGEFRTPVLHVVGGAWRNLALLQMRISNYPLQIVHQYEVGRRELLDAVGFIARQSRNSIERIEGVSKKRLETLPHAATVLEVLIDLLGLERIVLSAYGLREGLILDAMAPEVRRLDPMLEGCQAWGLRQGASDILGGAVEQWIRPLFAALAPVFGPRDGLLCAGACALADIGARLHPDHRADQVFDQVLRAPIAGLTHAERYFLAAACFSRHTAAAPVREAEMAQRLLTRERITRARALGSAIRLACDLSGRSPALLALSSLRLEGDRLVVQAEPDYAGILLGEQTQKRAQALAALLGRRLELRSAALAKSA